jgi:hypothetical protein
LKLFNPARRAWMIYLFLVSLSLGVSACAARAAVAATATIPATATRTIEVPTSMPTAPPTPSETLIPSPTPDSRIPPERWQEWPVVPDVPAGMREVYQEGIQEGNKPGVFLKIGDGEISTVWFLTQYDLAPDRHRLGPYANLEPLIQKYSGSFAHVGAAAGRGFDTTIILGPAPKGTPGCEPNESRLDCELRLSKPSIAIISMGTNQVWQPEIFASGLRKIIERLLAAHVVPILSTKADNLEGDGRINRTIASLAYEYDVPLWNFWLAVQAIPEQGLQADREHLTYAYSDFSNPANFLCAWPWRNLTALQVLNRVDQAVSRQP